MKTWLDDLDRFLAKAELQVAKCKETPRRKFLKRKNLSRSISKIIEEIPDIFVRQASVPSLFVGLRTNQTADAIKQSADEINRKQDEIQKSLHEERIAHKQDDRDARSEAQEILDNLRQLPDKIFGTDVHLAKLENLLLGESDSKWVGVCGRGGVGKTLLAGQAFNSQKVGDHFESRFWLTVGQNPSIGPLLQNLAQQMRVRAENMKPAEVKNELFKALRGKKVVLFLDDVWGDGVDLLDLLDVTSDTDSKILVTTRHNQVDSQQPQITINLRCC